MTATITTLQAALKTTLNGLASPPLPYTARIQEADVAEVPQNGANADVVIGFEASSRLGRTGNTILEQHLVPITIRRRFASGVQTELDASHALAEFLRDNLATYHDASHRVEQILAPHPFDNPQAVSPGMYVNRFVLDLDVLRTNQAITQDSSTPVKTLTCVREAAWNALNNWPEWNSGTWARKYYQDADLDELALHDPGEFDLPALAVTWGPTSPRFFVHIAQEWATTINVTAWFPAHQTTLAEYRAWQIVRAIWQCADPSTPTVSYIRAATGRLPEKNSPILIEPVELGRGGHLKAIKLTCQFVITGVASPLND